MAGETVLIVDDEPGVREALESIFRDEGYDVRSVASGEQGVEVCAQTPFDAVFLDVWLPGIDGLETLKRIREQRTSAEVVMISGHGTIETAIKATKLGAFDFIEKPLSLEKTLLVLRNALRHRRLERHNRQLLEQLTRDTEIIGRSAAAERLRDQVAAAAGSMAPVLICGEGGSGRETVARNIHARRGGESGPFVDLPCGALSADAAGSALFGEGERPGRLGLAEGGTLFLEDVERLDPAVQQRFATSWSQTGEDAAERVRIIASTRDPETLVDELRRRIEVARIDVPALRERREDVPLFAERFLRDLAREYGSPPKRWAPDCLAALKAHDWPGNVRELRNLVERLLLFVSGETIRLDDLPETLGGGRPPVEDLYREFASLDDGLRAFERYYIMRMLADEESDREAAARRLGMTVEALERRLARL